MNLLPQELHPFAVGLVIAVLLACLAGNVAGADALIIGAVVVLALLGVLTPEQAFSGFANTAMLTVAALYIVAAGLRETGALDTLGRLFLGQAKTERQASARIYTFVPMLSAFLNNTPIVAMFIPILTTWCRHNNIAPSKLLLPLSYVTILGGTCTLIGTSTNLVVVGFMQKEGLPPFRLFDLTYVGLPCALVGIAYLWLVGRRLLPNYLDPFDAYGKHRREYLVNMRVEPGCHLVGKEVEAAGLRRLRGLFLAEIQRGRELITPVSPNQLIEVGDILTFTGLVETIVELERIPGLRVLDPEEKTDEPLGIGRERLLHEAVISNTSPLVGKTIRDSDFRALYNAVVLAVHRGGERLRGRVGDIVLQPGDTLLLQASPHFERAHRNSADFFLVSSVGDSRPVRHDKARIAFGLLLLLIVLLSTEWVSTVVAAFLVAGLFVMSGCISAPAARQSLDYQTLLAIGASFGLGEAIKTSGLAELIAQIIAGHAETLGPYAVLVLLFAMTSVFTEVLTNNAAVALAFPFAISFSNALHVSPMPYVMAVCIAASCSFATPIGYQTNLMVYGPGGYRFSDFLRIGIPLNLVVGITAILVIPIFWPF